MNAFAAAEQNGKAADLQQELEALFERQNTEPESTAPRRFRRRSCASPSPVERVLFIQGPNHEDSVERPASTTAHALADRLEKGAAALASFAGPLSSAEWQTRIPGDGRTIGVVVHHVATMYPLEIQLAQRLAAGEPIEASPGAPFTELNAGHAVEHEAVTREAALDLLRRNSAAAAAAIRALSDEQLARAAAVSLYADAPLTCQFMLEDHAVRHSYHHLARMREALTKA